MENNIDIKYNLMKKFVIAEYILTSADALEYQNDNQDYQIIVEDLKVDGKLRQFQDGNCRRINYGIRSHHYYNQGYDFGLTLYGKLNQYLEDNNIRVSRDETLK